MKQEPVFCVLEGACAGAQSCPLSRIEPGTTVCIKSLATAPELTDRLRELGFCEQQRIKLVSRDSNYICQVCNARLGISEKIADAIMVEAIIEHRGPAPALAKAAVPDSALECSR